MARQSKDADERTETVKTGHGPEPSGADDVMSDPALDDRVGTDWADEGGATPVGPATSVASGDPEADGERHDVGTRNSEPRRRGKHRAK